MDEDYDIYEDLDPNGNTNSEINLSHQLELQTNTVDLNDVNLKKSDLSISANIQTATDHHLNELIDLESKFTSMKRKYQSLQAKTEQREQENQVLNKKVNVLKANISSLYKTAKSEIERKNQQIKDLQSEVDMLKFRRGRRADETFWICINRIK